MDVTCDPRDRRGIGGVVVVVVLVDGGIDGCLMSRRGGCAFGYVWTGVLLCCCVAFRSCRLLFYIYV